MDYRDVDDAMKAFYRAVYDDAFSGFYRAVYTDGYKDVYRTFYDGVMKELITRFPMPKRLMRKAPCIVQFPMAKVICIARYRMLKATRIALIQMWLASSTTKTTTCRRFLTDNVNVRRSKWAG